MRSNLTFRYSAIMRGAVLYGLGLNMVKERLMRRSYGVTSNPAFVANIHNPRRKFVDVDGVERCRDFMDWYAVKVYPCQGGAEGTGE